MLDFSQKIRDWRKEYNSQIQVLLIPEHHKDGSWHIHGMLRGIPSWHLYRFWWLPLRFLELETSPGNILKSLFPWKLCERSEWRYWDDFNDRYGYCSLAPIKDPVATALNEDGESNFNYKYDLGFDTDYYLDMKDSIDDATWMAKYMGNPYIREGLLFPADELRYYNGVLPDGEPDRIMGVVDTAWGGGDSLSMPVAYLYGEDVYIQDVVFNSGDKTVTRPLVIGTLKKHHPHMVRWESNNGGDEYGGIVDEQLRQDGVRVNMSYKKAPTNQSKLSRIIQYAPDVKRFYFIDSKHRSSEYERFMRELTLFTVSGKNLHDDAPDACAMLVDFISGGAKVVMVARRPF